MAATLLLEIAPPALRRVLDGLPLGTSVPHVFDSEYATTREEHFRHWTVGFSVHILHLRA